ncbi:Glucose--fructose oxidoreductase precursor [Rubripirellula obstinata]|uniref:Glucose--fructose oxidoreductase n=1 Tax=Rubripirellula obstinata TaxID=406547 RepID=A0A5B1CMW6_9BACT|nr:Gfo/Idh/MocA family oxidoreductase [Rubripirellula obstinata]KAA1260614.1 Glucose--fructose oxidoreductase precursor [Rubripirellula obstinata]
MSNRTTRRSLIKQTATAAGLVFCHGASPSRLFAAPSPNEKLNIACIGVGGRGVANVNGVQSQNIIAMVDVDENRAAPTLKKFPNPRRFTDYRKMFDTLGNQLDAVVISTPDHSHFHPASIAMQMGLHVYLEKPLAHTVAETRTLTNLAREKGIATQLGAQRHAIPNMHRVVEHIQAGAIGKVSEVHSWINGNRGMPSIPLDSPPVPSGLDYDLWIGPAKSRPYHPSFCPYGWRFWWDFGTGETGNWGCHVLDIPYWALGLKHPSRVDAVGPAVDDQRTPTSMHVTFQFAESNQNSEIVLHWRHGSPDELLRQHRIDGEGMNTVFIGSEGILACGFDTLKLYPEEKYADFRAPSPTIPDSPGFYQEWIAACRGDDAATCHFDYSGPLSETVLLGNVAYRAGGFDWDADGLKTGTNAEAQSLIQTAYRKGWEVV